MRHRFLSLAAALVAAAACGSGPAAQQPAPSGSPAPSQAAAPPAPSAKPTAGAGPLFAVLESPGGNFRLAGYNRVAIARPDGRAVAAVDFQPAMTDVAVCLAAVVPPPVPAYVQRGRVYFLDGTGAVRWLDPAGNQGKAAQFHLGPSQQILSFAVSPDGSRVVGARLTLPEKGPGSADSPCAGFSGLYRLELLEATPDGEKVIWQQQSKTSPDAPDGFGNLVLAGWDGKGPVAIAGSAIATQNAWLVDQRIFRGHLAHLDSGLRPADSLTPADCQPYGLTQQYLISCHPTQPGGRVSVLRTSGETLLSTTPDPDHPGDYAPSPSGDKLARYGSVVTKEGSQTPLPANFHPQGWIDESTIFGRLGPDPYNGIGDAALVRLGNPSAVEDLQFKGDFVGSL